MVSRSVGARALEVGLDRLVDRVRVGAVGLPRRQLAFDHGVMLHDVETEKLLSGEKGWDTQWPVLRDGLPGT